jgi:hypothetical protein
LDLRRSKTELDRIIQRGTPLFVLLDKHYQDKDEMMEFGQKNSREDTTW